MRQKPKHIYARLSLLQLIPDIAEAFQQERITASHANLIARLRPEQQTEAYGKCFRKDWQDKEAHLLPAKALSAWIDTNLYLPLADAPFPTDDPTLNPEAGACLSCPRRTGFNTQLFADVHDDNCLDGKCYKTKTAAILARHVAADPQVVQISKPELQRRGLGKLVRPCAHKLPAPSSPTVTASELS